jgi:hypothetical protein
MMMGSDELYGLDIFRLLYDGLNQMDAWLQGKEEG